MERKDAEKKQVAGGWGEENCSLLVQETNDKSASVHYF